MSIIEVKLSKNGIEYNGAFNTMKAWGQVTKDGVLIAINKKAIASQ